MRTQIAKTGYLPAEYIPPTFWLVPPPPFPQVDGGGCYREKFFLILFFWFYLVISWMDFYVWIFFLFFSESIINSFWLYFDFYFFLIFARIHRMYGLRIIFFIFLAHILLVFLIASFTPRFLFYHSLNFARSLSLS